jgi:hypothetical protein
MRRGSCRCCTSWQNYIISIVSLTRFAFGGRYEELSCNFQESLEMKVANFQWCSTSAYLSTDVSDTAQLAVSCRGIDIEFSIAEELSVLMPLKGTITGANLYEG